MLRLVGLAPIADIGVVFNTEDGRIAMCFRHAFKDTTCIDAALASSYARSLRGMRDGFRAGARNKQDFARLDELDIAIEFFAASGGVQMLCTYCLEVNEKRDAIKLYAAPQATIALCASCDYLDGENGVALMPGEGPYNG